MTLSLGVDTGGTFTDAVLLDSEKGVIASAKSLTTHDNLLLGIRLATEPLFASHSPADIGLVSLSTTLATNAIVENRGLSCGLILIGQNENFLSRSRLTEALGGDPVAFIAGGHDAFGNELNPLDEQGLNAAIEQHAKHVHAFAIAGLFSVRNSAHEERARQIIRERFDLPVTCSYELSAKLDAPKRALTTLLNARLIPLIHALIQATHKLLASHNIQAPVMIIRGDGAMISAATAMQCPVETILSGPAASVIGAAFLTAQQNVVVADIGGTTTDIAVLENGKPRLAETGATVGGFTTMVEAIALSTFGIGGDSEISLTKEHEITVGPRRAVPLSLFIEQHPALLDKLKKRLEDDYIKVPPGFAFIETNQNQPITFEQLALTTHEQSFLRQLQNGPMELGELLEDPRMEKPLTRLRLKRLVQLSAFTPSDATHVLKTYTHWSVAAATTAATLWLRYLAWTYATNILDEKTFAHQVLNALQKKSAIALIQTALAESKNDAAINDNAAKLFARQIESFAHTDTNKLVDINVALKQPLLAVGASAHAHYPGIARKLNAKLLVPEHAEVCNAVGAVAGSVLMNVDATISSPSEDRFRVHLPEEIVDFSSLEDAVSHAKGVLKNLALQRATQAGGRNIDVDFKREDNIVHGFGGHKTFLESKLKAIAVGRPNLVET